MDVVEEEYQKAHEFTNLESEHWKQAKEMIWKRKAKKKKKKVAATPAKTHSKRKSSSAATAVNSAKKAQNPILEALEDRSDAEKASELFKARQAVRTLLMTKRNVEDAVEEERIARERKERAAYLLNSFGNEELCPKEYKGFSASTSTTSASASASAMVATSSEAAKLSRKPFDRAAANAVLRSAFQVGAINVLTSSNSKKWKRSEEAIASHCDVDAWSRFQKQLAEERKRCLVSSRPVTTLVVVEANVCPRCSQPMTIKSGLAQFVCRSCKITQSYFDTSTNRLQSVSEQSSNKPVTTSVLAMAASIRAMSAAPSLVDAIGGAKIPKKKAATSSSTMEPKQKSASALARAQKAAETRQRKREEMNQKKRDEEFAKVKLPTSLAVLKTDDHAKQQKRKRRKLVTASAISSSLGIGLGIEFRKRKRGVEEEEATPVEIAEENEIVYQMKERGGAVPVDDDEEAAHFAKSALFDSSHHPMPPKSKGTRRRAVKDPMDDPEDHSSNNSVEEGKDEFVRGTEDHKTSYRPTIHFDQRLRASQADESTFVPKEILACLAIHLYDVQGLRKNSQIKLEHVRLAMYETQLADTYYRHAEYVTFLLSGIKPPQMPDFVRAELRAMFAFTLSENFVHKNRVKNYFFMYKACELRGYHEFLPYFPIMRGEDKIRKADSVWKRMCENPSINWEFIPTIKSESAAATSTSSSKKKKEITPTPLQKKPSAAVSFLRKGPASVVANDDDNDDDEEETSAFHSRFTAPVPTVATATETTEVVKRPRGRPRKNPVFLVAAVVKKT